MKKKAKVFYSLSQALLNDSHFAAKNFHLFEKLQSIRTSIYNIEDHLH